MENQNAELLVPTPNIVWRTANETCDALFFEFDEIAGVNAQAVYLAAYRAVVEELKNQGWQNW